MMCGAWGTPGWWQAEVMVVFQANRRGDGNSLPQRVGYGLVFHHLSQYKKQEALWGSQQEECSQGGIQYREELWSSFPGMLKTFLGFINNQPCSTLKGKQKEPLRASWLRKLLRFKFRGRGGIQECCYQFSPFVCSLLSAFMRWGLGFIFHKMPSTYVIQICSPLVTLSYIY